MSYCNFDSGNDISLHNMQHEDECTFNTRVCFCLCSVQVTSNMAVSVFTWLINQDDLIARLH